MVRAAALMVLALALGACYRPPEAVCVNAANKANVFETIYRDANTAVVSYKNDGTFDAIPGVERELARLESQRPFSYEIIALDSYDRAIRKTTCNATLLIRLEPSDRTPEAIEAGKHISGLDTPVDLLGPSPRTALKYSIQPSADGKGVVYDLSDAVPAVSALVYIAVLRAKLKVAAPRLPASQPQRPK